MKINFKQFREDINLYLFQHPQISFDDMKAVNHLLKRLENFFRRSKIDGNKN